MKEPVYASLTNMHAFSSYFLPFDKEQCILSMTKLNSTSCALAIRPSYIQNADLKKKKLSKTRQIRAQMKINPLRIVLKCLVTYPLLCFCLVFFNKLHKRRHSYKFDRSLLDQCSHRSKHSLWSLPLIHLCRPPPTFYSSPSSPKKAEGETVPLLRETMTLMPVSIKGTEKSMTSDLSSLMVKEPTAM